jgi:hypothetical protein
VIDNVVITLTNPDEPLPGLAAVFRLIDLSGTRAEKNSRRIRRISGQGTHVTTIRTNRDPGLVGH